jgi:pyruvate-formate lyase
VENFSKTFFRDGGVQINLNIMDLKALHDAIDHPENPEYQNIIIRLPAIRRASSASTACFRKNF